MIKEMAEGNYNNVQVCNYNLPCMCVVMLIASLWNISGGWRVSSQDIFAN